MAWKETCVMDERVRFIGDYLRQESSITALCSAYGISRKTGYKWIARYEGEGAPGLQDRSRAPHRQWRAVSCETEQAILALRNQYPHFGPKKIRAKLLEQDSTRDWPAVSTMGEILKRHGLVVSRRRKSRACPSEHPLTSMDQVNRVWGADFKGDFRTRDQTRCFPLTITDACSRYLLACQGLKSIHGFVVKSILDRVFRDYGLPEVIRTDNGPPFASIGIGGLTRLSIWWIQLGILPERITPGKPQQNGRHERIHRTLKEAVITPPKKTLREQQTGFDRFREEYNYERPHEALGQVPPGRVYQASTRSYFGKTPPCHCAYPQSSTTERRV